MNKKYIIRKNEEIAYIVSKGKKRVSKFYIIYNIESENLQEVQERLKNNVDEIVKRKEEKH